MVFTQFAIQLQLKDKFIIPAGVSCKQSQVEAKRLVFLPPCNQALGVIHFGQSPLQLRPVSVGDCQLFVVVLQATQEMNISTRRFSETHTIVGDYVCTSRLDTWSTNDLASHKVLVKYEQCSCD